MCLCLGFYWMISCLVARLHDSQQYYLSVGRHRQQPWLGRNKTAAIPRTAVRRLGRA